MSIQPPEWDDMRKRIIGLGEQSTRKSYYPELQRKIDQLEDAREKIRVSEANLRAMINGIPDALIIHDYSGVILDVNESFFPIYGITPGIAKSMTVSDISAPENMQDNLSVYWQRVKEGESVVFEWKAQRPIEKTTLDVEVALRPLRWYGKNVIIGVIRDISGRKRLECMLRQSQKMDAIGQLAGGFAHDFNNLLGGIIGYAELITMTAGSNSPVKEYADVIMTTATQAAEMARRLLDFSRKSSAKRTPVDIRDILKKTLSLLERTIDKKISLECDCAVTGVTLGDEVQLQNAFLNVCINARDAMPDGGKIKISLRDRSLKESEVFGAFRLEAGEYFEIRISDTGCGMSKETIEHIFEPFFTTKDVGKGTGLGLTAVYGSIRDHNGSVTVESRPGEGTVFIFLLPKVQDMDENRSSASADSGIKGDGERILVIDDEEVLRDMATDMLSRLGYSVETAADGVEGLEKVRINGGYDLVLLDAVMPRMNGEETLSALRETNPSIKVMFCSGSSESMLEQESVHAGIPYIQKPYSVSQLAAAVEKTLSAKK